MPLVFLTGFEWPNNTPSTSGGGLASFLLGSPTIEAGAARSGNFGLALDSGDNIEFGDSGQVNVVSFYWRAASLGSAGNAAICYVVTSGASSGLVIYYSAADRKLHAAETGPVGTTWPIVGTPTDGPEVEAGRWYRIDVRFLTNGSTWTVEWQVDGEPQPTLTRGSHTASAVTFGFTCYPITTLTGTFRWNIDDVLKSATAGDYPFDEHEVLALVPSGPADHQGINVAQWQYSNNMSAWTNFAGANETDSASRIDDLNGSNSGDGIRINATGDAAGNARWPLSDGPGDGRAPIAARAIIAVREAASGTNNATFRIRNDDGATATIFSGDPGWATTWNYLALLMTSPPGGGSWSPGDEDELSLEADSTDADPNIWLAGCVVEVAYPAVAAEPEPIIVETGQAQETDQAHQIAQSKTKALGQSEEADEARPVARAKTKTLGQAVEESEARPITPRKTLTIGRAGETEHAQPIAARTPQIVGVASAEETDEALRVGPAKRVLVGQAVEIDEARPLTRATRGLVGAAFEVDEAVALGRGKSLGVAPASETDEARPVAARKIIPVGLVEELDEAGAIAPAKTLPVGQTEEIDEATALGRAKRALLGTAVENDGAVALRPGKSLGVAPAVEADEAQPIRPAKTVHVGQALEHDEALPVAGGQERTLPVEQAEEEDLALPIHPRKTIHVGRAGETNAASPVGAEHRLAIGPAEELDEALSVGARATPQIGQAAETDVALPIIVVRTYRIGQAVETDEAQPVKRGRTIIVNPAVESNEAGVITIRRTHRLGQAVELDEALAVRFLGQVIRGDIELFDRALADLVLCDRALAELGLDDRRAADLRLGDR